MAVATKFENIALLAATNTIAGRFYLVLTAGSDAASVTLTVGSNAIVLKADANETNSIPCMLKIAEDAPATVSLSGTSPAAYAVFEVR